MKKILKIVLITILIALLGIAGVGMYVKTALPRVGPAPELVIERTAERIQRGEYLANSVAVCMDCHSKRDWSKFAGPIGRDSLGEGGEKFGREMGLPGTIYTRNITPYALSNWSDGEIFRAITTGVNKHGRALFPLMPYQNYRKMDKEDVYSIIAYLRMLEPVKKDIPEGDLDFPLNFIINTIPVAAELAPKPDSSDEAAYGKYLVTMGSCMNCHSQETEGKIVPGTEFIGGNEFKMPGGVVRTANLTPDKETGLGSWTKETFVKRFKLYADTAYHSPVLQPTDFNSPMPWTMYAHMSEKDLGSIYTYLHTLKPVSNKVIKFEKYK